MPQQPHIHTHTQSPQLLTKRLTSHPLLFLAHFSLNMLFLVVAFILYFIAHFYLNMVVVSSCLLLFLEPKKAIPSPSFWVLEERGMGNFAHFAKLLGFRGTSTLVTLRERERERERNTDRHTDRRTSFADQIGRRDSQTKLPTLRRHVQQHY